MSLYGMAYVCEEYFCFALEVFCRRWNVPDSVAGSLVMAAGNDAPEIFISFLGIFVQKNAIGIGTVVGSEIFNHMCISAGSCWYAKNGMLQLNGRHFTRDSMGYCSALIILLWAVGADPRNMFDANAWTNCLDITFTGSLVLIICQIIYCIFVIKFESMCELFNWKDSDFQDPSVGGLLSGGGSGSDVELAEGEAVSMLTEELSPGEQGSGSGDGGDGGGVKARGNGRVLVHEDSVCGVRVPGPVKCIADGAEGLWELVTAPLRVSVQYTVPDPHDAAWEPYYWLTIVLCTCWFAVYSFVLCECLDQLGVFFGISSVVMGITFSAVGTSFPNLWSSLVVARQGKGDMAISNALGSNTFNIFSALGLPWIVYCYTIGDYRSLQDGGIILLTLMLLVIMVIYYVVVMMHGWRLYDWYVMFCTWVVSVILLNLSFTFGMFCLCCTRMAKYMLAAYVAVIIFCCTI